MAKKSTLFFLSTLLFYSFGFSQIVLNTAAPNNGSGGIFLQLTTNTSAITVSKFNTYFSSTNGTPVTVQVYTRSGAYAGFTTSNVGWTLLGTASAISAGTTTAAPMDVASLDIKVPVSSTLSIYLHSITAGGGIRYTGTGTTSVTTYNDANVTLFSDVSRTGAVAFAGTANTPRAFAGSIEYSLTTLPVKWVDLFAKNDRGTAIINWKVEEANVLQYELEKKEGSVYNSIATIYSKGNGLNSYTASDVYPFNQDKATALYRIKQTDKDGRVSYSQDLLVRKSETKNIINVYPNPFSSSTQIITGIKQHATVTDMSGKIIHSIVLRAGTNIVATHSWKPGLYLLITENGETIKLLKQ